MLTYGDNVCFRITPCQDGDSIFYQVINNFYPEDLMQMRTCDDVCFTPTRNHAPMSMIVAYKVVNTENVTELLSASAKFEQPYSTQQQVSISVNPGQVRPGESVNIGFSMTGQGWVHYAGVDKSTQLAQDPNDITLAGIKEKVTATRIFDTQENKYPNGPMPLMRGAPAFMPDAVARKKRDAKRRAKRDICWGCGYFNTWTDPGKIMQEAGMAYMTDLTVYTSSGGGEDGDLANGADEDDDLDPVSVDEDEVRKDFPETWLFDMVETNVAGEKMLEVTVPDTITSWVVKAFAFNAEYGLGVATPAEVVVFKEFFLSMNLPYSVIRGERFELQLLVFNYKTDSSIQVQVMLEENTEGFDVIPRDGENIAQLMRQSFTVEAGASGSVKIPIRPKKIGDLVLRASATTSGISGQSDDAVERTLIVKPEGREVEVSKELTPVKFSNTDRTHGYTLDMARFITDDPDSIIEDSFRMYMYITGDMMGAFLNNLEGLIKMPFGCGEQNIMSLCPSIFVSMYLKSINRFDSETHAKAQKYCGAGYMRQQKYKYTHGPYMGSYSAFGQGSGLCPCRGEAPDPNPGSTWLTAFVLKVFSLLAMTDLTYVSRVPLYQAAAFLERTTEYAPPDNFFSENGTVIHDEMQGGTTAGATMTAYILSALMDYHDLLVADGDTDRASEIQDLIQLGTEWLVLKRSSVNVTSIPYQLAIVGYTLARASTDMNDVIFQEALELLGQYENVKDNLPMQKLQCPAIMFRPVKAACLDIQSSQSTCRDDSDCREGQKCCGAPCGGMTCQTGSPPYHQTGPSKIETLGYALMAYTQLADKARANPTKFAQLKQIAMEKADQLLSMRKAGGRFSSTQDTAVCLEALARYAMIFPSTTQTDFSVRAMSGGVAISEWISFDSDSYITTQWAKLDVPRTPPISDITFDYDGTAGSAFVTVQALYNTDEERRDESPFTVDVMTFTDSKRGNNIQACVRNTNSNIQISSMVLLEIDTGSGFRYGGVREYDPAFKANRVEEDKENGKVVVYYLNNEDDNFSNSRCYTFQVEEDFEVKDRKPGNIMVRDYYNEDNNMSVSYKANFTQMERTTEDPTTGCSHAHISLGLLFLALTLARAALAL